MPAYTRFLDRFCWEEFKNNSGEDVPPWGILAITGTTMTGDTLKRPVLDCTKPSTTFYRKYVVNGPRRVKNGKRGSCTRGPGMIPIAYDSGTPANEEGWGPKPGQFTLSKGYPAGVTVEGIHDSTNKILLGTLVPIATLLCKTTDAVPVGATTDYDIYGGTFGSEADAGFTTVPSARNRTCFIISGAWVDLHWKNNGWEMIPQPGYQQVIGKTDSAVSAGSSGTVSVWTGTPGSEADSSDNISSVRNRTGIDIASGDWVIVTYIGGNPYMEPWTCA